MNNRDASEYAKLHQDAANWRLGIIYSCSHDPRLVVPNRYWIGWTWNFGHRWVFPAIVLIATIAVGPVLIAWSLGMESLWLLMLIFFSSLMLAIVIAIWLSHGVAAQHRE